MSDIYQFVLPKTSDDVKQKSLNYSLFTWSPQKNLRTIEVSNAEGCYYWDYNGNKYFDLCSQLICVNIGHGNKKVIEAIKQQAEKITYIKPKFTTDIRGAAAEKIVTSFAPKNMKKVLFSCGGAESNEYAIRLAKAATGRSKIFSQYNSYHGATYGAANLCGDVNRNASDPQIGGFIHFFGPNYYDESLIEFDSKEQEIDYYLKLLEDQIIYEGTTRVAAIFLEGMTGGNGLIIQGKRYFQGVRKICDKYGILLVVDEVMTGFGRTGKKFCIDYYDVSADMITFAKGVTSAYMPLGGVLLNEKLSKYFDEVGVPIGCTYNSHPMCCAAALANLEVIEENNLIDEVYKKGLIIERLLNDLVDKHPSISEQRGMGLARGFMVHKSLRSREILTQIFDSFGKHGYPTNGNNGLIIVAPPFIVTNEEINNIFLTIDDVMEKFDSLVVDKE